MLFVSEEAFFLKSMGDQLLLSKDERLNPDIDKVMAVAVFWKGLLIAVFTGRKLKKTRAVENNNIAGLPISWTWGLRHNFCWRCPILIPRPDSETSVQTTRVHVLDFL